MGEEQREVGPKSPSLTIGRDPGNDLVVRLPSASRWHARVDLQGGTFILSDQSTNGTLLRTPAGRQIVLRREELILPTSGTVAIGEFPEDDRELPIQFDLVLEPTSGAEVRQ
jgi:pSer/pThr/pTyr-binding forkhead associated (FHA) protein